MSKRVEKLDLSALYARLLKRYGVKVAVGDPIPSGSVSTPLSAGLFTGTLAFDTDSLYQYVLTTMLPQIVGHFYKTTKVSPELTAAYCDAISRDEESPEAKHLLAAGDAWLTPIWLYTQANLPKFIEDGLPALVAEATVVNGRAWGSEKQLTKELTKATNEAPKNARKRARAALARPVVDKTLFDRDLDRVCRELAAAGNFRRKAIADRLKISPRTFDRKLEEIGVGFAELKGVYVPS